MAVDYYRKLHTYFQKVLFQNLATLLLMELKNNDSSLVTKKSSYSSVAILRVQRHNSSITATTYVLVNAYF